MLFRCSSELEWVVCDQVLDFRELLLASGFWTFLNICVKWTNFWWSFFGISFFVCIFKHFICFRSTLKTALNMRWDPFTQKTFESAFGTCVYDSFSDVLFSGSTSCALLSFSVSLVHSFSRFVHQFVYFSILCVALKMQIDN